MKLLRPVRILDYADDINIPKRIVSRRHVLLEIFDLNGRKVSTLVNEVKTPGDYIETWDGTDQQRILVPSGIYFYRIEVKSKNANKEDVFVVTKRFVLQK